jgi:hypothetical protein
VTVKPSADMRRFERRSLRSRGRDRQSRTPTCLAESTIRVLGYRSRWQPSG